MQKLNDDKLPSLKAEKLSELIDPRDTFDGEEIKSWKGAIIVSEIFIEFSLVAGAKVRELVATSAHPLASILFRLTN